ncbi:hypothetical protein B14911_25580 [Bacillus sp. NRRL B-14911]|nr:hypothetical protein B14911_25580 [Bacillus sp. NRRL B-14911]
MEVLRPLAEGRVARAEGGNVRGIL